MSEQTETNTTKVNGGRAAATKTERCMVPRTWLVPSTTNPRKTFTELEELAASFTEVLEDGNKQRGIINAIVVRPAKASRSDRGGRFEIVVGERRWRASEIAKMVEVPVEIRHLTDREVIEMQHVENAQRVDVPPLEEAASLAELLVHMSPEVAATRLGKSASYVAQRARLVELTDTARKAFEVGSVGLGIVLLLARHTNAVQDEFLRHHGITLERPEGWHHQPPTVQTAKHYLERVILLQLKKAPFDTHDVTLVPAAGACDQCPKRTGNQVALFHDVDADRCMDPECFKAKTEALYQRRIADPKATVLTDAEAKKVLGHGWLDSSSEFVKLDDYVGRRPLTKAEEKEQKRIREEEIAKDKARDENPDADFNDDPNDYDDEDEDDPAAVDVRKALAGVEVPVVLARDPRTHELVELVRKKDLELAAGQVKDKWAKPLLIAKTTRSRERVGSSGPSAHYDLMHKAQKKATEVSLAQLVAAATKKAPTDALFRLIASGVIHSAWSEVPKEVVASRELAPVVEKGKGKKKGPKNDELPLVDALIDTLKGPALVALLLEIVMRRTAYELQHVSKKDQDDKNAPVIVRVMRMFKIDFAKNVETAKAEAKEKRKESTAKKLAKTKRDKAKGAPVKAKAKRGTCKECGCTMTTLCIVEGEPCAWTDKTETLCTGCEE